LFILCIILSFGYFAALLTASIVGDVAKSPVSFLFPTAVRPPLPKWSVLIWRLRTQFAETEQPEAIPRCTSVLWENVAAKLYRGSRRRYMTNLHISPPLLSHFPRRVTLFSPVPLSHDYLCPAAQDICLLATPAARGPSLRTGCSKAFLLPPFRSHLLVQFSSFYSRAI